MLGVYLPAFTGVGGVFTRVYCIWGCIYPRLLYLGVYLPALTGVGVYLPVFAGVWVYLPVFTTVGGVFTRVFWCCRSGWKVFTGNEVAALLGWWMFFNWKENHLGPADTQKVYMLATTVSSKILQAMARIEGFHFEVSRVQSVRI